MRLNYVFFICTTLFSSLHPRSLSCFLHCFSLAPFLKHSLAPSHFLHCFLWSLLPGLFHYWIGAFFTMCASPPPLLLVPWESLSTKFLLVLLPTTTWLVNLLFYFYCYIFFFLVFVVIIFLRAQYMLNYKYNLILFSFFQAQAMHRLPCIPNQLISHGCY